MKILYTTDGQIRNVGPICELDYWDDEPNIKKWKIDDYLYALDNNYLVAVVNEVPDDWNTGKYLFVDGEFVVNPYWVEPPKSDAERIAELEEEVIVLQDENIASSEMEAELLYELSLMQLGMLE